MQRKRFMAVSVAAVILIGSGLAFSAKEDSSPDRQAPGMGQMRDGTMQEGMREGGMMGMMNMMERCNRMMDVGMMDMPQLPPGNEKLELQMQAEMMQTMGEILAKYAGQVKNAQGSAQ